MTDMSTAPILEQAIIVSMRAHRNQVDKHKNPYILHVLRVVGDPSLTTEEERVVAALHDVIEDTYINSIKRLVGIDLPALAAWPEALTALDLITRKPHQDYYGYIHHLAKNDIARVVKIADINDHLTPPLPRPNTLIGRYERARHKLVNWSG